MNIFVGIMCVAVAGVGIFGWWMENGKSRSDKESKKTKKPIHRQIKKEYFEMRKTE